MPLRVARRSLIAGASSLLAAPTIVRAQGQNGVALVIGNSKYKWEASLPNVKRDVADIAKAFQALGLKTELVQDASRDALFAAVEKFKVAANGANLAAFYYAGHGASWDKDTYLVPVDTDLATPDVVKTLIPVTAVRDAVKGAAHRVLVFDNCRNNPADGWRQQAATDSARITASALNSPNTLVLFSTAPGHVALDGPPGENSPFAAALLRQLEASSIDLAALPARLRRDLLIDTEGRQIIWDENGYAASFTLDGSRVRAWQGSHPTVDPSRLVELPKAYAFAREKKLPLPAGLLAMHPIGALPHGRKVGAFQYTSKVIVGGNAASLTIGSSIEPYVLIIMSVAEDASAKIIYTGRNYSFADGATWQLATARFSGNEMEWNNPSLGSSNRISRFVRWSDDNSGKYTNEVGSSIFQRFTSSVTRLDG